MMVMVLVMEATLNTASGCAGTPGWISPNTLILLVFPVSLSGAKTATRTYINRLWSCEQKNDAIVYGRSTLAFYLDK
jgi:hypothetical protein